MTSSEPPSPNRFGLSVVKAIDPAARPRQHESAPRVRLPVMSLEAYAAGVLAADRTVLGRALSLVESYRPEHAELAQRLLDRLLPKSGGSLRLGITGVPGAGKSTFIERLGMLLCGMGRCVAVLAVDPSSRITGGSILGDRTRMPRLSNEPRAFIRPSPSGETLGGVARRTREAMLVCEAAGFDVVIVETVGVGQSETAVADMSDCFLLLAIPGAGDELQGIKRGVLELVDVVAVNKADGDNVKRAELAGRDLANSLRVLRPGSGQPSGKDVPVLTCSAMTGAGIAEVWGAIEAHITALASGGDLVTRRREQDLSWFRSALEEELRALLGTSAPARAALRAAEADIRAGTAAPTVAARRVAEVFAESLRTSEGCGGATGGRSPSD